MSKHMDNIENYGLSVNDLDVSPFESMDMLHLRSKIEKVLSELTNEEIAKLFQYDLKLVENAKIWKNTFQRFIVFPCQLNQQVNGGGI